ncbi:MAG: metallophosphoesterase family protein [SAR324 cluster bacterium]|nr:metallophosphoesterase family protein [SAR324 cluster bacterium]
MDILAIPDIHGDFNRLQNLSRQIEAADIVLLVGDITNFGREREIAGIIEFIQSLNPQILAVTGNCDFPPVASYLDMQEMNIEAAHRMIDGIAFVGLGASLYSPSRATPNEVSEAVMAKNLVKAVAGIPERTPLVLVSHQPPWDTAADRINSGQHVGSHSVRQFVAQFQPLVCFSGHIHESAGIDAIRETQVVNPGPFFRGKYAAARIKGHLEALDIRRID